MHPPSTSSRSRTRTLQPPRARSAAQTSEVIPLPRPPTPPSRSRTRTLQPPRARSAAQTIELIPLPTTTASVIDQVAELVVADEPAFPRPELLHLREHFGAPLVGNVEPELLRFDPDRVEAALLAEHDPPLGVHALRGVRPDPRRGAGRAAR